jgi:hypothetical protein
MGEIAKETITVYKGLIKEKGYPVAYESKATVTVEGDKEMVDQVIITLNMKRREVPSSIFDFIVEEEVKN